MAVQTTRRLVPPHKLTRETTIRTIIEEDLCQAPLVIHHAALAAPDYSLRDGPALDWPYSDECPSVGHRTTPQPLRLNMLQPTELTTHPFVRLTNIQRLRASATKAIVSILTLTCAIGLQPRIAHAADRPNIVFILADDMGYGDLGCYGHPRARTPHLDALAAAGVRFTQHYANGPECSPTRTAFLTGRYQQRAGGLECAIGTGNVGRYNEAIRLAEQRQLGLPADQTVIPGALRDAGYHCGVFGKWHLGYEPHFNPMEHGWHEFFGYLGGNVHYFNHRETSPLHVLFSGRLPVHRDGYMTHLITEDSISFIQRHKNHPFFLYVSHECPHFPFQGPADADKLVTAENWTERDPETYIKMLEDLDAQVGQLIEAIDTAGLSKQTIIVFASDNGGLDNAAHMGPLRGAKSGTFEGGIRVPLIIRWPGKIKPGTVSHQVSATFDLTRSFLNLAGAKTTRQLDGLDLIEHVTSEAKDVDRRLFWRGRRAERTVWAVRDGNLKLVRQRDEGQTEEWLFDLAGDISETNDLSQARPAEVQRMRQLLQAWESDVRPVR